MRSNDRFGLMHEYAKVGYVWWTMMCHNSKLRLYLRAICVFVRKYAIFQLYLYAVVIQRVRLFGISKAPVMKYETACSAHRKSLFQTSEWLILIARKASSVD